jgi:tRNA (cmo5U34)-methyltransferase
MYNFMPCRLKRISPRQFSVYPIEALANMDNVKRHFENEARDFDRIILTLIPHYATMIRALVEAIPFDRAFPLRAIDLGCGTGTVAARVLDIFPNAQVTCLDLAENMVAMARERLAPRSHVEYVVADFSKFEFTSRYDVAISSLALHHLETDGDKLSFYRRVFASLNSGGVFYNADVVLASNEYLEGIGRNEWLRFVSQSVAKEEIDGKWLPKAQEEDHPAKLTDQLKWLAEIGFIDIDVIWKYYGFAVYGGTRP